MKKDNIIRETKDYNSFEFIDYNRNINQGHLKNITNSINQIGQINPISTFWNKNTKKYGIFDGQHRFLGVKTLQKPIKFIVYEDYKEDDLRDVNVVVKKLQITDWIKYYSVRNFQDYKLLSECIDQYKPTFSVSVIIQMFYKHSNNFTYTQALRKGTYKIDLEHGNFILKTCLRSYELTGNKDFLKQVYVRCFNKFYLECVAESKTFNLKRYFKRISTYKIPVYHQEKYTLEEIKNIYNKKR